MKKNEGLRERVCDVLTEAGALFPKEIIERVCVEGSDIQSRQVHNFLGNNIKNGLLFRNAEGQYSLNSRRFDESSKKFVYDLFKEEIAEVCRKYSMEIENPFEKFEGENLISAKKTYEVLKKIRKVL